MEPKLRDLETAALADRANSPAQARYLLGLIKISRLEEAWTHARSNAETLADEIYEAGQAPFTLSVVSSPPTLLVVNPVVRLLGAPRGEQGRAVVGRLPVADVTISSPRVAGKHCSVKHLGGSRFLLEDLKSANGTWVDGQRIASREVGDGARFSPATREIVVELTLGWGGEPWPTPPPALVTRVRSKLEELAKEPR